MMQMVKPGSRDKKANILITGDELVELKRHAWLMTEAFGLDARIEKYQGKRPIGFYSWDLDCLICVLEDVLQNEQEYPDRSTTGYKALSQVLERLQNEYPNTHR
jgi:hypothetical protein